MPPYQGGGDMIASVTFEKTTYADLPNKFEAGTPNIAGVVGLGRRSIISPTSAWRISSRTRRNCSITRPADERSPGLRIIGRMTPEVCGLVRARRSADGVARHRDHSRHGRRRGRTGHHCCQQSDGSAGIPSTAVSLAMYNTREDIDAAGTGGIQATGRAAKTAPRLRPLPRRPRAKSSIPR